MWWASRRIDDAYRRFRCSQRPYRQIFATFTVTCSRYRSFVSVDTAIQRTGVVQIDEAELLGAIDAPRAPWQDALPGIAMVGNLPFGVATALMVRDVHVSRTAASALLLSNSVPPRRSSGSANVPVTRVLSPTGVYR